MLRAWLEKRRLNLKLQNGWTAHVDAKFKNYERQWDEAHHRWQLARARQDAPAMVAAFEDQTACFLAERLAYKDMLLPFDAREARWDFDYLAEARAAIPKRITLTERLDVAESIMRKAKL